MSAKKNTLESQELSKNIINTVREPLIVLDQDLRVVTASRSFYEFFKVKPEDTVGQLIYDLGNKQWDIPKLRELLETILPEKATFDNYEVEHDFTGVGRRIMLLNARQIERVLGKDKIILLAIEDITERKRAEYELSESEKHYRILFNAIDEGFCIVEVIFDENKKPIDYRFLSINPSFEKQTGLIGAQGKRMRELAPKHEEHWFEIYGKIAVTGQPARFVNYAEQLHRWYDVYAFRFGQPENRQVAILFNDITERKEIEAGLEKTRKELAVIKIVADEALEYAENIINTVREPLIILDHDLRVVTASRSFYEFFKVNSKETVGQLIYDLGNKQWDIPKLRELLETILPQNTTFDNYEVEHDFPTIGKRIMLLNARQIHRALGKEHIILMAIEDITKHKLAEEKLILAAIVQFSKDAIIGMSLDGIITSWNKGAEEIYGYTESEIIGKSISALVPPEIPNELIDIFRKIKLGEGIENYETVRQKKDGQNIYVSITFSPFYDAEGRIVGASSIARDVTDRKRVEEALINSEKKYRNIFENATEGIFQSTPEGRYISINPAFAKIGGYNSPDEMMESVTNIKKIYVHQEERTRLLELFNKHDIVTNFETEIRRRDNAIIWISMNVSAIRDRDRRIIFLEGTIQDITERKRAEKDLKESEKNYRLLADNVHDVIFVFDINLNYTYVSPSVKILLGYEPEEALKHTLAETLTPSSDLVLRTLSEIMEIEKSEHRNINIFPTLELEMRRKDGTTVWTEMKASLIRDENQQPVNIPSIARDITERKKAEEELKQTVESLRKAVGATIQVMVSAVEMRDPYTSGHQLRVADLAHSIATEMGLPHDTIEGIRMAGSIHDIGKLSIPAEILSKPTKLTDIEFSLIKEHSRSGYEMLKDVDSPWPLAEIVYQHHERMNGTGYPRNLKGDEILMEARIMTVADVVEAMASHRPYRAALGIKAALTEIEKNKGIFYDNDVADACLRLFREKGFQLT